MPTKIDWCDETINPLGHGCYGPGGTSVNPKICPYCYAYKLAKRGMRGCELCKKFIPHTHFEQLEKLKGWKTPRNIFVQSMGDLFHDEIPDHWIQEVFKACEAAPQHNYLFLTKNPIGYSRGFYVDYNIAWFGTSVTCQDDIKKPIILDWCSPSKNKYLSIEPILGQIIFDSGIIGRMKWVIVGAETGNRKGKVIPQREWIDSIVEQCKAANVPVFMKESLRELMGDDFIQEFPEELMKK